MSGWQAALLIGCGFVAGFAMGVMLAEGQAHPARDCQMKCRAAWWAKTCNKLQSVEDDRLHLYTPLIAQCRAEGRYYR